MVQIKMSTWGKEDELMKNINKEELWCSYCKKARHTKEPCWKLHGKPQGLNWGGGVKGRQQHEQANFVNGEGSLQGTGSSNNRELGEFNEEVIKRLRKLLGSLEKPIGMCSFA